MVFNTLDTTLAASRGSSIGRSLHRTAAMCASDERAAVGSVVAITVIDVTAPAAVPPRPQHEHLCEEPLVNVSATDPVAPLHWPDGLRVAGVADCKNSGRLEPAAP
ncbi:hypothetical protein Q4I30_000985 [Leishmania utingensis]|uniref:Uncharacterized protein n=1 Tax=Leishmania utingensis TaxID=653362 RepID=A0AAW3B1B3_9TRYP